MLGRKIAQAMQMICSMAASSHVSNRWGLGVMFKRSLVPEFAAGNETWIESSVQNRPALRPIRLPALLRLRRRIYASCRAEKNRPGEVRRGRVCRAARRS